jgi:hypothetical protein
MADTAQSELDLGLQSAPKGMPEPGNGSSIPNPTNINLARTMLDPLNHAVAAGTREALRLGVPAHAVIEMQLNHLASLIAQLEPAGLRLTVIEDVVRQLSTMVRQHVDAKNKTPGGVIIPRAGL